ncbi:unnamed protein product [Calicophoron daubneyi]|uniref:Uncharacterized protein n=1 Tax=Calicophoron daubneyi TaxID=300641 RepID=A0AAV2TK02_CALDB
MLPYYIARHRKMAVSCFTHARSKEHGLKHIDIRKGILALFWIAVFIVVFAIMISMIEQLTNAYKENPVATQIKAEQDILEFPDISVCAKVPFYVEKNNSADRLGQLLYSIEKNIRAKLKDASVRITDASVQSALLIQMATRQGDGFLRAYQHIIYCQYHDQECSFYNFSEIVHLRYVQCYTFSPKNRQLSGGKGLQIIFFKLHGKGSPFFLLNDLEDPAFSDETNDGIHVLIHGANTFPTYSIQNMPTSFSLRYGQQATVEVSGLKYRSDMSGRKACVVNRDPYRYKNFRGGSKFLEYYYTYEDCVTIKKQEFFSDQCKCFSDDSFVPFKEGGPETDRHSQNTSTVFCRDIRQKTSQRLRSDFLCFDQYEKMPTTAVLDKFVPLGDLYATQDDLDQRKICRHKVCSLLCEKSIYSTRFFEVIDMDPDSVFPTAILSAYIEKLKESQLPNPFLSQMWENMTNANESVENDEADYALKAKDMVILDIRPSNELIDVWEEELTESLFNLISNMGGTFGLCAGISFLSFLFLAFFFSRAFFHGVLSVAYWFWWVVYLGRPPATDFKKQLYVRRSSGDTYSSDTSLDKYENVQWIVSPSKLEDRSDQPEPKKDPDKLQRTPADGMEDDSTTITSPLEDESSSSESSSESPKPKEVQEKPEPANGWRKSFLPKINLFSHSQSSGDQKVKKQLPLPGTIKALDTKKGDENGFKEASSGHLRESPKKDHSDRKISDTINKVPAEFLPFPKEKKSTDDENKHQISAPNVFLAVPSSRSFEPRPFLKEEKGEEERASDQVPSNRPRTDGFIERPYEYGNRLHDEPPVNERNRRTDENTPYSRGSVNRQRISGPNRWPDEFGNPPQTGSSMSGRDGRMRERMIPPSNVYEPRESRRQYYERPEQNTGYPRLDTKNRMPTADDPYSLQPPNRERTDVPNRWPGEYGTPFQTKSLVDDGGRRADGRKLSPTIPVDRGRTDERSDDIEGPPPINLPAEDQVRRSSGRRYSPEIRSDQARIGGRLSEFENQLQREMPSADRGGRTGERRLSPTLQPPNRERTDVPNRWPGEYGTPFQTKSLVDDGGRRADGRKLSPTIPVDRGRTDERSDDIEGPPPINLPAEDQVRRSSGRRYSPEAASTKSSACGVVELKSLIQAPSRTNNSKQNWLDLDKFVKAHFPHTWRPT